MGISVFSALRSCAAASLICLVSLAGPASAQSQELERQRQAVFAQLLNAPADRALMLQYARLSVRMRDFEAAAATLERFVDLEPGNVGARVELAIAYFSLGAYDVAEYHLAAAQASGALTPEQAERVAAYQQESAERDGGPHQFTGRLAVGRAWTREAEEIGNFGTAALEWRFDLGGPNVTQWLTQLTHASYMPGEQSFNDRQVTRLRTGPEFRLTGDAYGPRLQPYVEVTWFRDDSFGFGDYNAIAYGLAYQNPHDARWTSYADIQTGRAEAQVAFGTEFDFREASVALGYRPSRETRIRGTLRWHEQDDDFTVITTRGIRIDAVHAFEITGDSLWVFPRRWELRGFGQRSLIEQDFGGFFVDEITETSFGGGLRAFVTDEFFVEARGARLEREQPFFFQQETVYSLQIGWEF